MQLPNSGRQPDPNPAPSQTPASEPEHVRPPRSWGLWIFLLLVVAAVAGGFWYRQAQATAKTQATFAQLRTHVVKAGPLERTLRLTGTTSAEKYASLLAPQLRGSRGGFGRDARSFRSSTQGSNVSANTGTGGSGQTAASMAGGSSGQQQGGVAGSRAATGVQNMTSRVSSSRGSSGGSHDRRAGNRRLRRRRWAPRAQVRHRTVCRADQADRERSDHRAAEAEVAAAEAGAAAAASFLSCCRTPRCQAHW
ncbi:MAG: hypothetical protein R2762_20180 [Bryobacteraceae bacterium]